MSIPGDAHIVRRWQSIGLSRADGAVLLRRLAPGLALAAALAAARLTWNLVHGNDLFLDSWVLVHVLGVVDGDVERLPRATLTLHYPLSYLPLAPLAHFAGDLATVKYVYPVVSSLAAVPAYLLLRRGATPLFGALALLLLPDLAVKSLTGTPQGLALPLFVLALYLALVKQRAAFVVVATMILLTHHLTGMVTLIVYYTVLAMPESREPGWLRREWSYLLYFGAWPLYWAWTFYQIDQSYIWPIFLTLATFVGGFSAIALYAGVPYLKRFMEAAGARASQLPPALIVAAAIVAAAGGWAISGAVLDSPGLSTAAFANRAVVAIYAVLMLIGGLAALSRRNLGLMLLVGTLTWLGFFVLPSGCHRIFDGLRLADYAIFAGLVALMAPGLRARWQSGAIAIVLPLVFIAGLLRLEYGHERLFAISDAQMDAATWVRANTSPNDTVATDTKMSLLVLAEGERHATYEGSRWLFDGSPVAQTITGLNEAPQFVERPIAYVLLDDYMLERGADVGWFGAVQVVNPALLGELDAIGTRVYQQGSVTIWQLDERLTASGRRQFESESALDTFIARFFGAIPVLGSGSVCD